MATTFDDNERLLAELAKIKAETRLIEAQNAKARAEAEFKMRVEIEKMIAETKKIERETRTIWLAALVPLGVGILAALAVIAVKLVHG